MTQTITEQLELLQMRNPEFNGKTFFFRRSGEAKSQASPTPPSYVKTEPLILISDYFLNPDFDFHQNINKGTPPPKSNKLYITILKSTDKSVYIIGHYGNEEWSGWLPKKSFQVIDEE